MNNKQFLMGFLLALIVIPRSGWTQDVSDLGELSANDFEEDSALATQDGASEQAAFQNDFQADEIAADDLRHQQQDQAEVLKSDSSETQGDSESSGLLGFLIDSDMGSFASSTIDFDDLLNFDRTTDSVRIGGDLLDETLSRGSSLVSDTPQSILRSR